MEGVRVKLNPELPWQKVAFSKKKNIFFPQIRRKFEEETNEMLRLQHSSVWC